MRHPDYDREHDRELKALAALGPEPPEYAPLPQRVRWYTAHGYRVVSHTDIGVQLVKPKEFSFGWAVFWFLFFGVGVLIYVFYYAAKRDETLFLTAV